MIPRVTRPVCSQCKHFKAGRCKIFVQIVPDGLAVHTKVENARNDPFLCGPDALYFSDKDKTLDILK